MSHTTDYILRKAAEAGVSPEEYIFAHQVLYIQEMESRLETIPERLTDQEIEEAEYDAEY